MNAVNEKIHFSVIIPVFNKKPHLTRSINSVINQNHQFWQLILVDDNSNDGSFQILKYFEEIDARISVLPRPDQGPGGYKARNLGIEHAIYHWVAFLDADDEWEPNKLDEVAKAIEENPNCDFISSGWIEIRPNRFKRDDYTTQNADKNSFMFDLKYFVTNPQLVCTDVAVIKKSRLLEVGGFDSQWSMGADLDLWLRILMTGCKAFWINKVLATYYMDSVNMVTRDTIFLESPVITSIKRFVLQTSNLPNNTKLSLYKFSNRIVLYTIRKRLKHNITYKSIILKQFYFRPILVNKIYIATLIYLILPHRIAKLVRDLRII